MLVIVSDLHLTDSANGARSSGVMESFIDTLADLATRASWRADGSYRPLERFDLLLLGDVLDIIHSTHWQSAEGRLWNDAGSPSTAATVNSVVDGILKNNARSIAALRAVASEGAVRVPSADSLSMLGGGHWQSVAVRSHYMVGSHDWMLALPGAPFDQIREKVVGHLALANRHDAPFPHDPLDSDELLQTLRSRRVLARHGDVFDPLSFCGDRTTASINDILSVDLISRFVAEVEREIGSDAPSAALLGLREMENVWPLPYAGVWLQGYLQRTSAAPAIRHDLKLRWDRLAEAALDNEALRGRCVWVSADMYDGLARSLLFRMRRPVGWAKQTTHWLRSLRGVETDSYIPHALTEPDFRNRRARHIVYGHTHHPEAAPLEASHADGFILQQSYVNTGSWRRTWKPTCYSGESEFVAHDGMTMAAFYEGDERGGRPFETITATVGVGAGETAAPPPEPQRRETPIQSTHAPGTTAAHPFSAPAPHQPHFAAAPSAGAGYQV